VAARVGQRYEEDLQVTCARIDALDDAGQHLRCVEVIARGRMVREGRLREIEADRCRGESEARAGVFVWLHHGSQRLKMNGFSCSGLSMPCSKCRSQNRAQGRS